MSIAYAVAIPIYGKKQIDSELPLHATLKGQTWRVEGTLAKGLEGGTVLVEIDRVSGKIVYLMHGK
ncbi:NTF2 fold immunity protein [Granulicella sp. L46]|uniref:NTF2 fold immunity protein n=1 Tax=Granulicella sp. L46 TaxID=1641865 RepID=UPI00131CBEB2|nr:NTF2 fold immunity protein [Granulicella sp. L46]